MMGPLPTKLTLSEAEKASSVWQRLKTHFEQQLQVSREKNDALLTPDARFAVLVEIHAAKLILDLDRGLPNVTAP
jgi:hypothetical protein